MKTLQQNSLLITMQHCATGSVCATLYDLCKRHYIRTYVVDFLGLTYQLAKGLTTSS